MQNIFEQKFGKAIDILKIIEKNGYEAYFVGGCVRDYLLDVDFSDIDVTTNALPEQVKEIFGKTIDTGLQHGTVTVIFKGEAYEITTFRTESDYSNHRAPDKVEFVRNLKEDLDRRDFTINAMAMDSRGVIYDFHNGVTDLKNGVIRTVNNPSERFYEDALRMLRAFRFSSKLNFEIEESTFFAIKKNAKLIEFVSVERIVSEFKKLLAGVGCKNSLEKLISSEIHKYIPFLKYIKTYQDLSPYTFTQSLYYLSYFNNIDSVELKKLKLSNIEIKKIKKYENIKYALDSNTPLELILYKHEKEDVQFVSALFKYYTTEYIANIRLKIHSFYDVEITSKEIIDTINLKPGPWIKDIISQIEKNILLNKLNNRKEEIIDFLLKIK